MRFRELMLRASRWLDAAAEQLYDDEAQTIEGRISRLEITSVESHRRLLAEGDALRKRVKELEDRPTAAHRTYESVHVGGGRFETREVVVPPRADKARGHGYTAASANVPDPVKRKGAA